MLITPEYVEMNRQMHAKRNYGLGGWKRASDVMKIAVECEAKSILDYGCGQGHLRRSLTLPVREYDPAIPGKDSLPNPADIVVCADVLEHVEPECLDNVIQHLKELTRKICYAAVHLTPAKKCLPDGRNAHLIQESEKWWEERLAREFDVLAVAVRTDPTTASEAIFILGAR